jgi:hypothetical protein
MSVRRAAWVLGCAAALAGAGLSGVAGPAVAGSGPAVEAMIVGSGGSILTAARTVTASAANIRVGSRTCALAAGTPLAVLADLRGAGGPPFLVRDYGHCGASPRNSGELFVYSLDGEANRAQNGWEYKVDQLSGSTGAGSSSGASGNGSLLRSGERVLWFWCQAYGGGCQRTLEVSAPATVAPGGHLSVRVTGYENEGHASPVSGAIVTLGSDFATTSSSGQASLIVPSSPGRYRITAARRGMVPSFPWMLHVR